MNENIFLLLGSNQGNAAQNVAAARAGITRSVGVIIRQSSLYKSAAWGLLEQPDFCNQVIEIASALDPENLLDAVMGVERKLGRVRRERWGPRIIDIDVLLYGREVIDTDRLKVPHPGIPERRFTLEPLAEIAPALIHPVIGKSIAVLLQECGDPLTVGRWTDH